MKSKQAFLSLSLLPVGAVQLFVVQEKVPIPITASDEVFIIIRSPDLIRINCVYDTDNDTFIFGLVVSTETINLSINNLGTNKKRVPS